MLHLNRQSLKENSAEWEKAGITLYSYADKAVQKATQQTPQWVHFGGGNIFRASVIDVSRETLTLALIGDESKISAIRDLLAPFGILELARTGILGMERGKYTIDEKTKESSEFNYGKSVK